MFVTPKVLVLVLVLVMVEGFSKKILKERDIKGENIFLYGQGIAYCKSARPNNVTACADELYNQGKNDFTFYKYADCPNFYYISHSYGKCIKDHDCRLDYKCCHSHCVEPLPREDEKTRMPNLIQIVQITPTNKYNKIKIEWNLPNNYNYDGQTFPIIELRTVDTINNKIFKSHFRNHPLKNCKLKNKNTSHILEYEGTIFVKPNINYEFRMSAIGESGTLGFSKISNQFILNECENLELDVTQTSWIVLSGRLNIKISWKHKDCNIETYRYSLEFNCLDLESKAEFSRRYFPLQSCQAVLGLGASYSCEVNINHLYRFPKKKYSRKLTNFNINTFEAIRLQSFENDKFGISTEGVRKQIKAAFVVHYNELQINVSWMMDSNNQRLLSWCEGVLSCLKNPRSTSLMENSFIVGNITYGVNYTFAVTDIRPFFSDKYVLVIEVPDCHEITQKFHLDIDCRHIKEKPKKFPPKNDLIC